MLINDEKFKDFNTEAFYKEAFRPDLLAISNSRNTRKSTLKVLHQQTGKFILDAQEKASVKAFEINLVFPEDQPKYFEESWFLLRERLLAIENLLQSLPVYAALVGIEIHKKSKNNTTFKKELPESTSLGGRPHIHICLLLFNDFLCPTTTSLIKRFYSIAGDVECVELALHLDSQAHCNVKDWFMYCTKELTDKLTQSFLKKYCNLSSSGILYSGHSQSRQPCLDLCSVFSSCNINVSFKSLDLLPNLNLPIIPGLEVSEFSLIPRTKCNLVKVNHFMKALFLHYRLSLWPDKIHTCRLISNSLYTYERYKPLSEIYSFVLEFFPIEVQELLIQPEACKLYMLDYAKYNLNYLPVITLNSNLIELGDGVFNFRTGVHTLHSEWTNSSSISCVSFWPHISFDSLPWPETCISIVNYLSETT